MRVREPWGARCSRRTTAHEAPVIVRGRHRLLQAVWQPRVSLDAGIPNPVTAGSSAGGSAPSHTHTPLETPLRAPPLPGSPSEGSFRHPRSVTLGLWQVGEHVEGVGCCGVSSGGHLRSSGVWCSLLYDFTRQKTLGTLRCRAMADVFESTSAADGFHLHGERKLHFVTSVRPHHMSPPMNRDSRHAGCWAVSGCVRLTRCHTGSHEAV